MPKPTQEQIDDLFGELHESFINRLRADKEEGLPTDAATTTSAVGFLRLLMQSNANTQDALSEQRDYLQALRQKRLESEQKRKEASKMTLQDFQRLQ